MRIHGKVTVKRRETVEKKSNYKNYKEELIEDFSDLCGYCGKEGKTLREKFTVDHFVPVRLDKERENDYSNLVLSCMKCNRGKWDWWPTEDKSKANDGKKGFVDPTSSEYDTHLIRNEDGTIEPKTDIGIYMFEKLKFKIRPMKAIWKVMQLKKKEIEFKEYIDRNPSKTQQKEYIEVLQQINELLDLLYERKETV